MRRGFTRSPASLVVRRRARAAVAVVLCALAAGGVAGLVACKVPPTAQAGAGDGNACTADVDCAAGLSCACGVCTGAPPDGGLPPLCEVTTPGCPTTRSPCYAACGDERVVGVAQCEGGRENCQQNGGRLRSQCPSSTCWGTPLPGQECVGGRFVCSIATATPDGACFTDDCPAGSLTGACVESCNRPTVRDAACVSSKPTCLGGLVDGSTCAGCAPPVPTCIFDCAHPDQLQGFAQCTRGAFACANGVLADTCGAADAGPVDAGLVDAGLVDAGLVDAGLVDAGLVDAGLVDAG